MRLRLVGFAIVAVGLLLGASPVAAQEVADATCPGPATSNRANGPVMDAGNSRFAQTFTAQHGGTLTTVQLGVTNFVGTPADWVLQILPVSAGVPAASGTLGSSTIDDATIPTTGPTAGEITAHPSPAPVVTAGQEYAVAVTHPGSNSVGVRTVPGDPCAGDLFFGGPAPQQFFPEGSTDEMVFAAFVTPVITPPPGPGPAPTQPAAKRNKCKHKKKGSKPHPAAKKKKCKKKKKRR